MKKIITLAAAIMIGLAGTGTSLAGKKDDTLTALLSRDIYTVDGLYSTRTENSLIGQLTDDTLFIIQDDGTIGPNLAESFHYRDDKTLDVVLHDNVKFHDGSVLTAEDVVYSLNYLLDKNAKTAFGSQVREVVADVRATGPLQLQIRFHKTDPLALNILAVRGLIRKAHTYDGPDGALNTTAQNQTLNGLGPYRITRFVPGQTVELTRFADYRQDGPKGSPAIGKVVFRAVAEEGTRAAELASGNAEWTYYIADDATAALKAAGRVNVVQNLSSRVAYLVLDAQGGVAGNENGPVTKKLVRQALSYAIDKPSIVQSLTGSGTLALDSLCAPAMFGCSQEVAKYTYDPKKARALLAEAGYPQGFSITLQSTRDRPALEAIVEQWRQAGVDARLSFVPSAVQAEMRRNNQVIAFYQTWGTEGRQDAGTLLGNTFVGSNRNLTGDKRLEPLVRSAQETFDPQARRDAYQQALSIIAEEAYLIPLFQLAENWVISPELDISAGTDGLPRFYRARWKE